MDSREEREASRREVLGLLARKGFQDPENSNFYHGRLKYFLPHLKPKVTWASKAAPRGSGGASWITASELQVIFFRRFFQAQPKNITRVDVVDRADEGDGVDEVDRGDGGDGSDGVVGVDCGDRCDWVDRD